MSKTKQKGEIVESIIQNELIRRGYTVLRPFGENERYDLVVDNNEEFIRIQCKHAPYNDGSIICDFRTGTIPNGNEFTTYSKNEIDVFAVYSLEIEEMFWIPFEDTPETGMSLRVEQPDKKSPKINWAEEYKFDGIK